MVRKKQSINNEDKSLDCIDSSVYSNNVSTSTQHIEKDFLSKQSSIYSYRTIPHEQKVDDYNLIEQKIQEVEVNLKKVNEKLSEHILKDMNIVDSIIIESLNESKPSINSDAKTIQQTFSTDELAELEEEKMALENQLKLLRTEHSESILASLKHSNSMKLNEVETEVFRKANNNATSDKIFGNSFQRLTRSQSIEKLDHKFSKKRSRSLELSSKKRFSEKERDKSLSRNSNRNSI